MSKNATTTRRDTTMYPCHSDCWLVGTEPAQLYDYEDADYDVYLFWPSSSPQIFVPANARYADEVGGLRYDGFCSHSFLNMPAASRAQREFTRRGFFGHGR